MAAPDRSPWGRCRLTMGATPAMPRAGLRGLSGACASPVGAAWAPPPGGLEPSRPLCARISPAGAPKWVASPSPGGLPDPGTELGSPADGFIPAGPRGSPERRPAHGCLQSSPPTAAVRSTCSRKKVAPLHPLKK